MRWLKQLVLLAALTVFGLAGYVLYGQWQESKRPDQEIELTLIDRGAIAVSVVESGSLESSDNATVKCKVEAILGTTSSGSVSMPSAGAAGGGMRAGGSGAGMGMGGGGGAGAGGARGGAGAGGAGGAGAAAGGGAAAGAMAGGGGGMRGGGGGGAAVSMPVLTRPRIRSFSYNIPNYVSSLKNVGGSRGGASRGGGMGGGGGMRGGGGGGGGGGMRGGGGGGGMMMGNMATGSTKIISILPEGTLVKPGDLVAELDSATFRTELESQKIRVTGVKSDLEQVKKTLEVAEISLEEFRDGVFPQDKMLLNQYIAQCELRTTQSQKNLTWSKDQTARGLRSETQLKADEFDHTKNKTMLEEAMGMKDRLEKFTAPRILKELQARIEAVRTDFYAIQKAYQLEIDRQKKIEEMIANCRLEAPRDGIVVYANESNMWGRTEAQIAEGATVREGQAVFKVPNPNRMLVKAQINESKISYIRKGQKTQILIDAFPDKPLAGTVTEITAIPAPPKGFSTDIRAYVATVSIDIGGFEGLRPGMAAEVAFDVTTKDDSLRVPVDSIMFVNEKPFVAVPSDKTFQWRSIDVGLMNESYAEVKSGLSQGEKIVAMPGRLSIPLPQVEPVSKKSEPSVRAEIPEPEQPPVERPEPAAEPVKEPMP